MKSQLLMLSAAGLLALAAPAQAASAVDRYLEQARAEADARLAAAGVAPDQANLAVKARVNADGRLTAVRVVRSSGSLETDQRAARELRLLKVAGPPAELNGREVTLDLGGGGAASAATP